MWRKSPCCCRKDPGPALGSAPGLQCVGVVSLVSWMHLFKRPPPFHTQLRRFCCTVTPLQPLVPSLQPQTRGAIGVAALCVSLFFSF